jgi:hypothetical protein
MGYTVVEQVHFMPRFACAAQIVVVKQIRGLPLMLFGKKSNIAVGGPSKMSIFPNVTINVLTPFLFVSFLFFSFFFFIYRWKVRSLWFKIKCDACVVLCVRSSNSEKSIQQVMLRRRICLGLHRVLLMVVDFCVFAQGFIVSFFSFWISACLFEPDEMKPHKM